MIVTAVVFVIYAYDNMATADVHVSLSHVVRGQSCLTMVSHAGHDP